MRRIIAILLLLVFGLPLAASALALTGGPESTLAACCRKNGVHHCAETMQPAAAPSSGIHASAIPQHCPSYPAAVTSAPHRDLTAPTTPATFATTTTLPAPSLASATRARLALDLSRPQRGPPPNTL